jgi:hypothetical protein
MGADGVDFVAAGFAVGVTDVDASAAGGADIERAKGQRTR